MCLRTAVFSICLLFLFPEGATAVERQALQRHVPAALKQVQSIGRLPATNELRLSIGLPLRDPAGLTRLLDQLYDPASTNYHRYLSTEEFTAKFGPTEADYQAVVAFAKANRLQVTATHANRMLVSVAGTTADIEAALHVRLNVYPHPKEARLVHAPNAEPSLDLAVPIAHVSGLDNYRVPKPRSSHARPAAPRAIPAGGSGPGGTFLGSDFRTAYVPGTTLTGTGQSVALVEFDGYYSRDITAYRNLAGLPNVPVVNVLVDGYNGVPVGGASNTGNEEVALDIEMAIAMAPGLTQVLVYEASPSATMAQTDDMLNKIATDNVVKQIGCSWGFDIDATTQQIFQQYAAQGQSFYLASGDNGAFVGAVEQPSDDPYITVVGGTVLTTSGTRAWSSETVWSGSGGGISTAYPIPAWQQGVSMLGNRGSTTMRNVPDVAMVAQDVWVTADNGSALTLQGTSIAAPLWAAFTALVNQQAAAQGKPPVGFLNPALYALGKSASYATNFHDITSGDNTWSGSPTLFHAVTGFDLCTGWGSPAGTNFINALLAPPLDPLQLTPALDFSTFGRVGGPFSVTTRTYSLTNNGGAPLYWALSNPVVWLDVSPTSGTLNPGDPATSVQVQLNAAASSLLIGSFTANLTFTNLNTGGVQTVPVNLSVGNGSFETGDLSFWTPSGNLSPNAVFANSLDYGLFGSSGPSLTGVNDLFFVHSGLYGAFLGQSGSLAYLTQTLPTVAGHSYLVSFWLANPTNGTPNEFTASWNGTTLYDQVNLGQFGWTNLQFLVKATGASTVLQFGFRNDPRAFALDDISVLPIPSPVIQSATLNNGTLGVTWSAVPGAVYQLQYSASFNPANWLNLGPIRTANTTILNASDGVGGVPARYYRIILP
ncbi:MAG: hypothetical protein EBS05_17945 [Proteobacteria bacterium]|nr:hypothetical protein [Pseudomonadota bacterium]